MDITPVELRLLLRLLGYQGYRATLKQIQAQAGRSAASRDRLCQRLQQLGLIDYSQVITQFGITAAGRTLLGLDTSTLPITPDERWILKSCQSGRISPAQIHPRVPATSHQHLLQSLAQRGLIRLYRTDIQSLWLTPEGQRYLCEDYQPTGDTSMISLSLLGHYLQLIRQQASQDQTGPSQTGQIQAKDPAKDPAQTDQNAAVQEELKIRSRADAPAAGPAITAEDVLQTIADLDRQHRTHNYLPLFYLRQRLQPPLSREDLDRLIFLLQRQNRIDLSSLQDVTAYSDRQRSAGIPQDIGGDLFFIGLV